MNVKNFKLFLESLDDPVLESSIQEVITLMNQCVESGWKGEELDRSYECIVLEDSAKVQYNGWYEKLVNLKSSTPELNEIDKLISLNTDSLWNGDLEDTFQCVILEDIDVDEPSNDIEPLIYNGWDKKLELLK